jgi:hypothetical protein
MWLIFCKTSVNLHELLPYRSMVFFFYFVISLTRRAFDSVMCHIINFILHILHFFKNMLDIYSRHSLSFASQMISVVMSGFVLE